MSEPVSVIVPTRDRPGTLASCLAALAGQTAAARLEVIVVDDGSRSSDDVSAVVARHAGMRLVHASGTGPAAARNRGAEHAAGSILCFTDDDCVPHRDWAEQLASAIEAGADAAAGTTLASDGALSEAAELVSHAPARPVGADAISFAPSNNLACSRSIWESIRFDESYPDAAGEDRDWCARLAGAGYVIRSAPAARLVHRQELTLRSFVARQVRYGEGAFRFRRRGGDGVPLESPAFYLGLLRDGFARGVAVGLLVTAAQAATAFGFARAAVRSRQR